MSRQALVVIIIILLVIIGYLIYRGGYLSKTLIVVPAHPIPTSAQQMFPTTLPTRIPTTTVSPTGIATPTISPKTSGY